MANSPKRDKPLGMGVGAGGGGACARCLFHSTIAFMTVVALLAVVWTGGLLMGADVSGDGTLTQVVTLGFGGDSDACGPPPAPPTQHVRKGVVNGLLYYQLISAFGFNGPLKSILIDELAPEEEFHAASARQLAIVGLPNNEYVQELVKRGYSLYIVESSRDKLVSLREALAGEPQDLLENVRVVHATLVADPMLRSDAGAGQGAKEGEEWHSVMTQLPLSAVVESNPHVFLLKIDAQGDEAVTLRSAATMLQAGAFKMIWVKITWPCEPRSKELLEILVRNYYLFDTAWWGQRKGDQTFFERMASDRPARIHDFHFSYRPDDIEQYTAFMCEVQQQQYAWLQTDIVAVHHDYLTPEHIDTMGHLADVCQPGSTPYSRCWLSTLVD